MAVMGELRKRMWLIVVFIGIAMAGFLLMDGIGNSNVSSMGADPNTVGTFDGSNISTQEYEQFADSIERLNYYRRGYFRTNESFSSEENFQIRNLAWDQLVINKLLGREMRGIGLGVTRSEMEQIVFNRQPFEDISGFYYGFLANPGEPYDVTRLQQFLQAVNTQGPRDQTEAIALDYYGLVEKNIYRQYRQQKYLTLWQKSSVVPKWMAESAFRSRSDLLDARFLAFPFYDIELESEITEADMLAYMQRHPWKYKQEESRDLDFVTFDIIPRPVDTAAASQWIEDKLAGLKEAKNDSSYVAINSRDRLAAHPAFYTPLDEIVSSAADSMKTAAIGDYIGPFYEDGAFKVFKLKDRREIWDSVRTKSIFIGVGKEINRTEEQAKLLLDTLKMRLDTGYPFDSLAMQFSDAGNAARGGDNGWLQPTTPGVPRSFAEALFFDSKPGQQLEVRTGQGWNLVRIDSTKNRTEAVKFARLQRMVVAGDETKELRYAEASKFLSRYRKSPEVFDSGIATEKLQKRIASGVQIDQARISGLQDFASDIVQWSFREKQGSTRVFKKPSRFVVVMLRSVNNEGMRSLESVEAQVRLEVEREKKTELIKKRVKETGETTLDGLAEKLGTEVLTASGINFESTTITGLGNEPLFAPIAIGLPQGEISAPFRGNTAVLIVESTVPQPADMPEDFSAERNQIRSRLVSKFGNSLMEAFLKAASAQDMRFAN